MKLRTPITGTLIDVADEKAAKYIERGFQPVEVKKPARRRTTKKGQ